MVFKYSLLFLTILCASTVYTQNTFPPNGNVGIGTNSPDDLLSVNGQIHAKSVKVDLDNWPDYVFEEHYDLKTLEEIAAFIKVNGHLEGIPSAKKVETEGINLGETNKLLLEKIEELTLHLIEKDQEIQLLKTNQDTILKLLKSLELKPESLQNKKQ